MYCICTLFDVCLACLIRYTCVGQEADIAAAAVTITADRETVVDFSFPYWEEPSGILIRRPGEGSKLLTLLKPLQWSVWATVICEVILASVAIYACTIFANRVIVRRTDTIMAVFHNCLWYCFGVLTNQGACIYRSYVLASLLIVDSCPISCCTVSVPRCGAMF